MESPTVQIGPKHVGPDHPCFIVGEIGINHNGDVAIAKKLIDYAVQFGFDAVKFQKRTIDVVYTAEDLDRPRESPFGTTNRALKAALEFGQDEYTEIDRYCRDKGILWFVSPWDEASVDFCEQFDPPCYKVASASITDLELLGHIRSKGRPVVISTGMSTIEEIDNAVAALNGAPLVVMHSTSTYPAAHEELNLAVIPALRERYGIPVGYSGHEVDIPPTIMAIVGFGADMIERHITLNRAMWGSDQAASIEPRGMQMIAKYVKIWEEVRGDGRKRVYDSELPIRDKLRRVR
jgi:N-acetylneuraminate synthase